LANAFVCAVCAPKSARQKPGPIRLRTMAAHAENPQVFETVVVAPDRIICFV
jgi:hypothetical protein